MIHINRAGSNLGIFSEEDVRAGLRSGQFAASDLGWREGMANWQPLSQFPDFAADVSGAPPLQPPTVAVPVENAPRSGLPWDERHTRGFLNAFAETLMMVLLRPGEAFTTMRREGGLGEPLLYALVGAGSGAIVSFLFSMLLQSVGISMGNRNGYAFLAGLGIGSVLFVVLLPFLVVIGLFLGSAIVHVCLMIVGGAKQPFETTFRVVAFAQGSTGVLQMIPICGGIVAGVWALVVQCIGLARAHETETGRAVVAILLPLIVCCGGTILLGIMFGMLGVLGHHGGF
jgi:hypothetical protein